MNHIREYSDQGYRVRLDLSHQVLSLDIPELRSGSDGESVLSPTLPLQRGAPFVSAATLAMKAKQFDDGLYAAVELAAQNGAGKFSGKAFLLTTLLSKLHEETSKSTQLASLLCGACQLGGLHTAMPPFLTSDADEALASFLTDEIRSKPIGFYTWSRELEAIFRQDRILQEEQTDEGGVVEVARVLHSNERLRRAYEVYLELISALTNPLSKPDLRPWLMAQDSGKSVAQPMFPPPCFFPPSRSHETDLPRKLPANKSIQEGDSLMDELIARIRSGDLPLQPTEQSGWYDYQTWSIEPLVIPESMPEAKHLRISKRYREHLLELFKGIYALTRETHVKQLGMCPTACCPSKQPEIDIQPELTAEPLVTYYQRRALSYKFIHKVLTTIFGNDGLLSLNRLRPTGPVSLSLGEELQQMESLFHGAYLMVSRQLGLDLDRTGLVESEQKQNADLVFFRDWAEKIEFDEDLGQDARMMVPLSYDPPTGQTRVWIFLGWTTKPLQIKFDRQPRVVSTTGPGFFSRLWSSPVRLNFTNAYNQIACPVTAEVQVKNILNRNEFRRHCDAHKTKSAILAYLH